MGRDRRVQLLAALVMILCLAGSSVASFALTASVGRNHLAFTDQAQDGDPPEVALGIAMGAFRGLFVNVLWLRANNLKEAGRYYEAIELSSAITRLQPRFPAVWVFHAWNMSYNISVVTQTAEERWEWVQAGVRLLRDKAIPANPNTMLLHKELAWIFLHKIQGYTDDANNYYKRQMAGEWTRVLGEPPRPDPLDLSRTTAMKRYADWIRPIAESPDDLATVVAKTPSVRTLVDRLTREVGQVEGIEFLRRVALHEALAKTGQTQLLRSQMGAKSGAFTDMMEDPSLAEAWPPYIAFQRRRVLIESYNMEPERMVRFVEKYGPIDWRHPCAHGLYWSARGVEQGLIRVTDENRNDFDFINTDRIVMQSLQELYRSGEIYFDYLGWEAGEYVYYLAMPNPHFVEPYHQLVTSGELLERNPYEATKKRPYRIIAAGYENFLKDAVRFFYRRGQIDEAEKWYARVGTWDGQNMNNPWRVEEYSRPLSEFVEEELKERFKSPSVAVQEIGGALQGAYTSGLLAGNGPLFRAQFEYAKRFHRYFLEQQLRETLAGRQYGRLEMFDRDFGMVAGGVFTQMIGILPLEDAETMYDNAPNDLKQYAYDMLVQRFKAGLEEEVRRVGGRPFEEIFPEPPGMARFRVDYQQMIEEREALGNLEIAPK